MLRMCDVPSRAVLPTPFFSREPLGREVRSCVLDICLLLPVQLASARRTESVQNVDCANVILWDRQSRSSPPALFVLAPTGPCAAEWRAQVTRCLHSRAPIICRNAGGSSCHLVQTNLSHCPPAPPHSRALMASLKQSNANSEDRAKVALIVRQWSRMVTQGSRRLLHVRPV